MLKRNDIIERVAKKGYTKKDSGIILDDIFATITEALVAGESVQIHGFGTFGVKECRAREVIDFQTKNRITVPSYNAPKFTPGNFLKRAIKEKFIRE